MPVTPNRNYPYPVENSGDWYNTFVEMITAIDSDMANLILVGQTITMHSASPFVRFAGTEGGGRDFRFIEDTGVLYLQKNTGTFDEPVWENLVAFTSTGDIRIMTAGKGVAMADDNGVTRRFGYDVDGVPLTSSYP